jgi:hypothetical protein
MKQFNLVNGVMVRLSDGAIPNVSPINTLNIIPLMTVDLPPVFGPVKILFGHDASNVASLVIHCMD